MAQWLLSGSSELFSGTQATTSPNITFDAFRVSRSSQEGYVYVENALNLLANQSYTFTLFVKAEVGSRIITRVGKDLDTTYVETSYSLTEESIEAGPINFGNLSNPTSSIQSVGDGWYAIQTGFFTGEAGTFNAYITSKTGDSDGLLGNDTGASSFFMWNAQLERRLLETDPSYLGSSQNNVLSIPDITFTFLPIWRGETSLVTYPNTDGGTEVIDVSIEGLTDTADFNTADAVEYVRIPNNPNHGFPSNVTIHNNRGGSDTVSIGRQPRYEKREPIQITFLNKEGVLEDLWAIRRSTESLSTNSDTYYRNVIDYNNLSYNTFGHTMQKYNVVTRKSIVVNTDFLPESYNDFFEQLYNSEYVWLTYDGRTRAVVLKNSDFTYKTHVNDKLVQYELMFEYSNRLDNTIR